MLVRLGKHIVIVRVLPRSCTINNKKMSQESASEKVYRCINNLYVWFSELCATWDACDDNNPEESALKDRMTRFFPKSLNGSLDDIAHDVYIWGNMVQKRQSRHRRKVPLVIETLRDTTIKRLCSISTIPEGLLPHSVYVEDTDVTNGTFFYKEYKLLSIIPENMTCILLDPETKQEEEAELADINVDWLVTVWERCQVLSAKMSL